MTLPPDQADPPVYWTAALSDGGVAVQVEEPGRPSAWARLQAHCRANRLGVRTLSMWLGQVHLATFEAARGVAVYNSVFASSAGDKGNSTTVAVRSGPVARCTRFPRPFTGHVQEFERPWGEVSAFAV